MTAHRTLVYTYARTFDGLRSAAWRCSCGAAQLDLPTARDALKAARPGSVDRCAVTGIDLSTLEPAPLPTAPVGQPPIEPACCTWWAENEPRQPCLECNR